MHRHLREHCGGDENNRSDATAAAPTAVHIQLFSQSKKNISQIFSGAFGKRGKAPVGKRLREHPQRRHRLRRCTF